MKPERQIIAIAKACGGTIPAFTVSEEYIDDPHWNSGFWQTTANWGEASEFGGKRMGLTLSGRMSENPLEKIQERFARKFFPDYIGSLDAMREAELRLWRTNPTYYWTYADIMLKEVVWKNGAPGVAYQCATAAQRAEAFLRTLGEWKESAP